MVCAHIQDAGYRGALEATHRLGAYCRRGNMEKDMADSSSCAYSTLIQKRVIRFHSFWVLYLVAQRWVTCDVLHFDRFSLGRSEATNICGLVDESEYHMLALMDDVSRFVWLEEAESCSMGLAARALLKWYALFWVPKVFTSDDGIRFIGRVMLIVSSR